MSGIVGSNLNIKGSGLVATLGTDGQVLTSSGAGVAAAFADIAAGLSWQAVETGSSMTAVAGNGYPINTTSNTCTITLPASATNGDQIIFTDYARTWGTNNIEIDSNGLNYQGDDDTFEVKYSTDGLSVHIVYSGATKGWIPTLDEAVADVPVLANDNGLFAYGQAPSDSAYSNIVSNTGVVATDVAGVGTARSQPMGCEYGGDKGIFAFGNDGGVGQNISNLVSNTGVVGTDVSGVGTARWYGGGCHYGGDKGIFAYGYSGSAQNMSNLVTNAGVVGTDVTGVGTARYALGACEYGEDKGIFGYGDDRSVPHVSLTNLVSNSGVIGTDVTGVGTARDNISACSYGGDKGIFGYGYLYLNMTNLVSNTGVVGTDVTGVGTGRYASSACEYGKDKGIFGFGDSSGGFTGVTNLVSNTGVVATDTPAVATAGYYRGACSFN